MESLSKMTRALVTVLGPLFEVAFPPAVSAREKISLNAILRPPMMGEFLTLLPAFGALSPTGLPCLVSIGGDEPSPVVTCCAEAGLLLTEEKGRRMADAGGERGTGKKGEKKNCCWDVK